MAAVTAVSAATTLFAAEGAGGTFDLSTLAPEHLEHLKNVVGHPDIKPGIPATRAAGVAWSRRFLIEEYDAFHLRATISMNGGLFPISVIYRFSGGKIESFTLEGHSKRPDLESLRRRDLDDLPWITVDHGLYGYAFQIAPTWAIPGTADPVNGNRMSFVGLPKIEDEITHEWVENGIQWCVFGDPTKFRKLEQLITADEKRLASMGTQVVKREKATEPNARLYTTTYRDRTYRGKTYFLLNKDTAISVRFNATPGTYAPNLPRFERFMKTFRLTRERVPDADVECIETPDAVLEVVGGSFSEEERRDLAERVRARK